MVRSTGDEELKAKADGIVAELAKCQEALGGQYLSAFPEAFLDRLEQRDRVTWAPLYVIHKVMAGLYDMHTLAGNQQAREVLVKMADYYAARAARLTDFEMERMLTTEFGGMSEVLHNVYSLTGDPRHLEVANRYDQAAFLGPLALRVDNLSHIHGNTQIPKICGAARRHELTGEPIYRDLTEFFWQRVVQTRTYATGGTTSGEVWPEPNRLADTLSATNQECCKTHNMLKVTRYLLRWTGEPAYADYYQRAFWNGIMGTQDPTTGMLMYYVPLATGQRKTFGTPYDSFWCCYGTGIESFAKLGDSIYFHDDEGVYVNLLVASDVRWPEKGLRLEQRTSFPEQEGTTLLLHLRQPRRLAVQVHIPEWATEGVEVLVNGAPVREQPQPSSDFTIEREWSDGDAVEVRLPMRLHAAPMPDDPELVAIMYGPLVLAGLTETPPVFLADADNLDAWVQPVEGRPLRFRTAGQETSLDLLPLYQVTTEPYGVYWVVTHEGSERHLKLLAEAEARRKLEARIVDRVAPGDEALEAAHNLQGENTQAGPYGGRHWRHAPSGWWSWDLKVLPDTPMALLCLYWGSDVPPRTFDILVDGQVIATQSLDRNKPGDFLSIEYPIPEALTRGKERITVRFQAHEGNTAGGVFECATLRPER